MGTTNTNMDRQYTYSELSAAKDFYIKKIDNFIGKAVLFAKKHEGKNPLTPNKKTKATKLDDEFIDYQNVESFIYRNWKNSREHKLDSVIINEFNRKNGTDIDDVKVSYGLSSDEFARQNHALALTVGNVIYFRNGAYKPETEDGRKLLMHELTHVAQNKDSERNYNKSEQEKESEAEQNEVLGEHNPDPDVIIKVKNKYVKIRRSKLNKEADKYADKIIKQIQDEYERLNTDEERLNFIVDLENQIQRGERKWIQ
ncbi:MAG: DUF4157 domain-containing protein [Treponema sp.]|nr:DUF4157 domain-containing protein [Treponema sp.]